MKLLSCVRPSVTPWTAAHQAPPSMGFSRQEYWSGVPLPSPDLWQQGLYITWQATPVLLPRKSHGQRSLVGCSPWGRYESDMTKRLHFHFSLSYIGGGNGNSLQYSCLENPRDGRAWWTAVYGVAQSWTWLKRLSSSSSSWVMLFFFFSIRPICLLIGLFRSFRLR